MAHFYFRKGTGGQRDLGMIRGLVWPPGRREELKSKLITNGQWFTQSQPCNGSSIKPWTSGLRELPDWWAQGTGRLMCPERGWSSAPLPHTLTPMPTWLLLRAPFAISQSQYFPEFSESFWWLITPGVGLVCRKPQCIAPQSEVEVTTWELRLGSYLRTEWDSVGRSPGICGSAQIPENWNDLLDSLLVSSELENWVVWRKESHIWCHKC